MFLISDNKKMKNNNNNKSMTFGMLRKDYTKVMGLLLRSVGLKNLLFGHCSHLQEVLG